ncbi:MAG: site-specific integrase, partial [Bacteroidota bacterium]
RTDIENLIKDFRERGYLKKNPDGTKARRRYSEWAIHDRLVTLKKFYRWLRKAEDYPQEVRWIKTSVKNGNHKLPEELLNENDVEKMINAADHPRDKAFIATIYESGCRIGEILSLQLKNVSFDEKTGCKIIVDGKTGMRRVWLFTSAPYLAKWINIHPDKKPESYLWVSIGSRSKNKPMDYSAARSLLRRIMPKAGINKKFNPHLFRHSRATYLADKLTEAQLKEIFGWKQSSTMPGIYVHMSGRNTENALKRLYGLGEEEKEEESKLTPKKCIRCGQVNPSTFKQCDNCGMALDLKSAIETAESLEKREKELNNLKHKIVNMEEKIDRLIIIDETLSDVLAKKKGLRTEIAKETAKNKKALEFAKALLNK